MRSLIFLVIIFVSCTNTKNNEIIINLNDFKLIKSLENNKNLSNENLYLHVYQSTCSVCFVKLIEWEKKFSDCEFDRENHYFLLIGGHEETVKYYVCEQMNINSNIYFSEDDSLFKLLDGSFEVQKIDDYLLLFNKIQFSI